MRALCERFVCELGAGRWWWKRLGVQLLSRSGRKEWQATAAPNESLKQVGPQQHGIASVARLPVDIRKGSAKEFMYFFKRELPASVSITNSNLNDAVLFGCSRGKHRSHS